MGNQDTPTDIFPHTQPLFSFFVGDEGASITHAQKKILGRVEGVEKEGEEEEETFYLCGVTTSTLL